MVAQGKNTGYNDCGQEEREERKSKNKRDKEGKSEYDKSLYRHGQEWPMSVNELGLVLVTPKAVTLPPGGLVEARGALWEVLAPHELDAFKNEYEIGRTVDL